MSHETLYHKAHMMEHLGVEESEHFMKDFKLFHLRQKMTSGTKVPGILLLILNLVICYLAIFDGRIT
jgi:hypothetical protein